MTRALLVLLTTAVLGVLAGAGLAETLRNSPDYPASVFLIVPDPNPYALPGETILLRLDDDIFLTTDLTGREWIIDTLHRTAHPNDQTLPQRYYPLPPRADPAHVIPDTYIQ